MIWLSVTPKSNAQFISEAILDNLDKAGVPEPDDVRHPSSRRYPITFRLSLLSATVRHRHDEVRKDQA